MSSSDLKRQRTVVAAIFLVHGLMLATWASHIPHVKDSMSLSEGALGLVLLVLAGGAVAAMSLTGALSARLGAHRVTKWATVAMAATLPLPLAAGNVAQLVVALFVFGAALGAMDVAMNAVAAEIETRFGRPIMSSFHGMFSAGALTGSLIAAGLLRLGVRPLIQASAVAVLIAMAIWPSLKAVPRGEIVRGRRRSLRLPGGRLLVLGMMAFAVMLGEGSVLDWSATLLRDDLGASNAVAALGFGAFSVTMAIGRFTGDRMNARLGPVPLVGIGAGIAAVGLGAGLLIGTPGAVIFGFVLMGMGFANIIPIIFTAAAASGPTPAEGISTTATLGYLGFLAGPPLIGALAELSSLTTALVLVVILTLFVAARAPVVAVGAPAPAQRA